MESITLLSGTSAMGAPGRTLLRHGTDYEGLVSKAQLRDGHYKSTEQCRAHQSIQETRLVPCIVSSRPYGTGFSLGPSRLKTLHVSPNAAHRYAVKRVPDYPPALLPNQVKNFL